MREKIARKLMGWKESLEWDDFCEADRTLFLGDADQILTLLKQEIEKGENPYPESRQFVAQHDAFENCRDRVLTLLKEQEDK